MCYGAEAIWIPLAAAAISGGVTYANNEKTAKRQDNALAASLREQSADKQKASNRAQQVVRDVAANQGSQTSSLADAYRERLQQASGQANKGLAAEGAVSDRYNQDLAAATLGLSTQANNMADTSARIDGALRQRQQEGIIQNRGATDIATIDKTSASKANAARIKLESIRNDPLMSAFASALAGFGSSYTGSGAGAAAGTSVNTGSAISPSAYGWSGLYQGARYA